MRSVVNCSYNTHKINNNNQRRQEKTFGGNGQFCGVDFGEDFTYMCM